MSSVWIEAPPPLRSLQNADGGWGYRGGPSWTEPTVFALLALSVQPDGSPTAMDRGLAWLARTQRPDGGWAPHPGVDQSTWVTALALLLLSERPATTGSDAAIRWLMAQTGRESGYIQRLRAFLLGGVSDNDTRHDGWPWFPGAAAWVIPTSLSVIALAKLECRRRSAALHARIGEGRQFLLARTCADGGWNHGASRALGESFPSYPETTGLALLALHGAAVSRKSLECAERHLRDSRSAEALGWLRLGLSAHGRAAQSDATPPCRTLPDAALLALAAAASSGRNVFL
jgi:hypothetical protein